MSPILTVKNTPDFKRLLIEKPRLEKIWDVYQKNLADLKDDNLKKEYSEEIKNFEYLCQNVKDGKMSVPTKLLTHMISLRGTHKHGEQSIEVSRINSASNFLENLTVEEFKALDSKYRKNILDQSYNTINKLIRKIKNETIEKEPNIIPEEKSLEDRKEALKISKKIIICQTQHLKIIYNHELKDGKITDVHKQRFEEVVNKGNETFKVVISELWDFLENQSKTQKDVEYSKSLKSLKNRLLTESKRLVKEEDDSNPKESKPTHPEDQIKMEIEPQETVSPMELGTTQSQNVLIGDDFRIETSQTQEVPVERELYLTMSEIDIIWDSFKENLAKLKENEDDTEYKYYKDVIDYKSSYSKENKDSTQLVGARSLSLAIDLANRKGDLKGKILPSKISQLKSVCSFLTQLTDEKFKKLNKEHQAIILKKFFRPIQNMITTIRKDKNYDFLNFNMKQGYDSEIHQVFLKNNHKERLFFTTHVQSLYMNAVKCGTMPDSIKAVFKDVLHSTDENFICTYSQISNLLDCVFCEREKDAANKKRVQEAKTYVTHRFQWILDNESKAPKKRKVKGEKEIPVVEEEISLKLKKSSKKHKVSKMEIDPPVPASPMQIETPQPPVNSILSSIEDDFRVAFTSYPPNILQILNDKRCNKNEHESFPSNINIQLGKYAKAIRETGMPEYFKLVKLPSPFDTGMFVDPSKSLEKGAHLGFYTGKLGWLNLQTVSDSRYIFDLAKNIELDESTINTNQLKDIHGMPLTPGKWILVVDADKTGNYTRYFNHAADAKEANAEVILYKMKTGELVLCVVATKEIKPGEQILIHYGKKYWKKLGIEPKPLTPDTFKLKASGTEQAAYSLVEKS